MRYIVRIVGPSGYERYLHRGGLYPYESATIYRVPYAARKAMDAFMKTDGGGRFAEVLDKDDPERVVSSYWKG